MNRLTHVIGAHLIIAALAYTSATQNYQIAGPVLEVDRNHKATHLT